MCQLKYRFDNIYLYFIPLKLINVMQDHIWT